MIIMITEKDDRPEAGGLIFAFRAVARHRMAATIGSEVVWELDSCG